MNVPLSRYLLLLSVAAYVACLPMPAFCSHQYATVSDCWRSWHALAIGWLTLGKHGTHLIWFANPILLMAWLLIATAGTAGQKVAALVLSGLALIVAACFLLPVSVVLNDGGVPVGVSLRAAGYWLWLGSMVAAFAAAVLLWAQALPPKGGS